MRERSRQRRRCSPTRRPARAEQPVGRRRRRATEQPLSMSRRRLSPPRHRERPSLALAVAREAVPFVGESRCSSTRGKPSGARGAARQPGGRPRGARPGGDVQARWSPSPGGEDWRSEVGELEPGQARCSSGGGAGPLRSPWCSPSPGGEDTSASQEGTVSSSAQPVARRPGGGRNPRRPPRGRGRRSPTPGGRQPDTRGEDSSGVARGGSPTTKPASARSAVQPVARGRTSSTLRPMRPAAVQPVARGRIPSSSPPRARRSPRPDARADVGTTSVSGGASGAALRTIVRLDALGAAFRPGEDAARGGRVGGGRRATRRPGGQMWHFPSVRRSLNPATFTGGAASGGARRRRGGRGAGRADGADGRCSPRRTATPPPAVSTSLVQPVARGEAGDRR
jgi:hypothetical protein